MCEQLDIQINELTDEEIALVVGGEFAVADGLGAFSFSPFFNVPVDFPIPLLLFELENCGFF